MQLSIRRKYLLAFLCMTTLFLLNFLWLRFQQRYDTEFHSTATYALYLRTRALVLQPTSVVAVVLALAIWVGLLYWKSRVTPLTDRQKIVVMCVLLSVVGGYILTAWFRL